MNSLVSLNSIRTHLMAAQSRAATAELRFKAIEGDSNTLRKMAESIETYEARHDDESKDISDEGKAAVKALAKVDNGQKGLQGAHAAEEAARRELGAELIEAKNDAASLRLPATDKSGLLNSISFAQQADQSGGWSYQGVDTALYAAGLQLPSAQDNASDIAGDDKGKDVRVKGEQLEQNLERLAKSYADTTTAADRSETQQDQVGQHVDSALREVDRLENRALKPYLEDVPFVAFASAMHRLKLALDAPETERHSSPTARWRA